MKSRTVGFGFFVACVATGALALMAWPSLAVEAVYPIEHAKQTWSARVWSRVAGFLRGGEAEAENVRLRRELAELAMLRGDLRRLEAENARLRRALDYAGRMSSSWLSAAVLSRGGGAAGVRSTLRVDKGSLAGVRAGAVVAAPEGLVGQVTTVTPHTSEVTLITDPSIRVACIVESTSPAATGILSGGTGNVLTLRHLRSAGDIPVRRRVLSSGQGGVFPPGLVVGTLLNVCKDPKGLVRAGEVLPLVDFSALEDVFICHEK